MSKYSSATLLRLLLVLFGILFLADTALTTIILSAGGHELNPHPIYLPIRGEHPNLVYLWAVRLAILGFLCWATLKLSSRWPKMSLALAYVLTALSLAGVCWNGIVAGGSL